MREYFLENSQILKSCSFNQFFKVHHDIATAQYNKCISMVHMWWFSKRRRSGALKVDDASVNDVDPLASDSSRKQHSKNKKMLIFNLVYWYAQIPVKQNYLQETVGRIVTCFMYLRHSNIVLKMIRYL